MLGYKNNKLVSDSIWQIGGSIVNRFSYFITLFILSGIMPSASYGMFGLIYNISGSVASINSNSLGIVTRRELVKDCVKKASNTILVSNGIIIFIATVFFCAIVLVYELNENIIQIDPGVFFICLLMMCFNSSISYYLNYHYSGLGNFATYNKILLPINILLPALVIITHPHSIIRSVLLICLILFIGNFFQVGSLLRRGDLKFRFNFQTANYKTIIPCFLQSLLGLPVFLLLQFLIISRFKDFVLIGLITIATQILNMSNIFATKLLTVYSPNISRIWYLKGCTPPKYIMKLYGFYQCMILAISFTLMLALPYIIKLFNCKFDNDVNDIRYFIFMNIFSSSIWFFIEYFHAIKHSIISLVINLVCSILIYMIFFVLYYYKSSFNLINYANCISIPRIMLLIPCIILMFKYGNVKNRV